MSIFYEFTPIDTLFFRGSVPMEAGQHDVVSMFPPPVSVLEGAIRTCVLEEHGINIQDYLSGKDTSINSLVGNLSEKAPFHIVSILIKKDKKYFAKAPVIWYLDSKNKPKDRNDYLNHELIESVQNQRVLDEMFVMSSCSQLSFVKAKFNPQLLGNIWISIDFLKSPRKKLSDDDFLLQSEVFSFENRIGIALDSNRHTEEGQLFSSVHIRLLDGITIVVGISKDAGLNDFGKILLGGEKRLCNYRKIDFEFPNKISDFSNQFLSLAPVEGTEENLKFLVASSKLSIISGWDLARGFHKPTINWIPAGAVFTKNINEICIKLPQIGG